MTTGVASPSLAHPAGAHIYEYGIWAVAIVMLAVAVHRAAGGRWRMLGMVLASASAFWQETYGDWGTYMRYSQVFARFSWPGPWTSPVKAWWFIAGYVVFYCALYGLLIILTDQLRRRRPNSSPYLAAALLTLPVFYLFDLLFEGTTTALGYWKYGYTFGPSMHIGHGNFPLVWPILEQVPFLMVATVALAWRDGQGRDAFERIAARGPAAVPAGVRLVVSWIVAVNIEFALLTTLPLMAVRGIFGPHAPFPN